MKIYYFIFLCNVSLDEAWYAASVVVSRFDLASHHVGSGGELTTASAYLLPARSAWSKQHKLSSCSPTPFLILQPRSPFVNN